MFEDVNAAKQNEDSSTEVQNAFLSDLNNPHIQSDKGRSQSLPLIGLEHLAPLLTTSLQLMGKEQKIDIDKFNDSPAFYFNVEKHKDPSGKEYYLYNPANPPGLYGGGAMGQDFNMDHARDPDPVEFRKFMGARLRTDLENSRGEDVVRTVLSYKGRIRDASGKFYFYDANDLFSKDNLTERSIVYKPDKDGKGPNLRLQGIPESLTKNVQCIRVYKETAALATSPFNVAIELFPKAAKHPETGEPGMAVLERNIKISHKGEVLDFSEKERDRGVKYKSRTLSFTPTK